MKKTLKNINVSQQYTLVYSKNNVEYTKVP